MTRKTHEPYDLNNGCGRLETWRCLVGSHLDSISDFPISPAEGERAGVRGHLVVLSTCARLVALLLCLAAAHTASAQSLSIGWFKIAGGGGTSTGGGFALSGTIGQPDASGPLTNGQYSARGGFWMLPVAVQVIGSPTLTIAPAGPGPATLSWSPSTPGFILQEAISLSSPNWTNAPSGVANPVTVPTASPAKFYRLIKP